MQPALPCPCNRWVLIALCTMLRVAQAALIPSELTGCTPRVGRISPLFYTANRSPRAVYLITSACISGMGVGVRWLLERAVQNGFGLHEDPGA